MAYVTYEQMEEMLDYIGEFSTVDPDTGEVVREFPELYEQFKQFIATVWQQ